MGKEVMSDKEYADIQLKKSIRIKPAEYKDSISIEEKIALREKQIEMAMQGNVQMLIWLGKQYLGQLDKQEVEHIRPISEIEFNGI